MSLNGIWKVEMIGPDGWEPTSTAFLEEGTFRAASTGRYSVGEYEVSDNQVVISATGRQFDQGPTILGKQKENFDFSFKGKFEGDVIEGAAQDSDGDYQVSFRLIRLANLP